MRDPQRFGQVAPTRLMLAYAREALRIKDAEGETAALTYLEEIEQVTGADLHQRIVLLLAACN